MAYGGLRGAVGFSLVTMISHSHVPASQMLVTTTLAMVMFTVFLQGGSIKFFVNFLNIDKKVEDNVSLAEEINKKVFEHVMAGIEVISGKHGHFYVENVFNHYDKNYLKKWFCVKEYDNKMKKVYEEVSLGDHFLHLYGPTIIYNETLQNNVRKDIKEEETIQTLNEKLERNHIVKFLNHNKEELQRCKSLPVKVKQSKDDNKTDSERCNIVFSRLSLRKALNDDPLTRLHHVYDKNLVNAGQSDIGHHLQRRKESARRIRERIRSQEVVADRPSTVSTNSVSMDNLPPSERMDVNILIEKHQELRRRKSTQCSLRHVKRRTLIHQISITPSIDELDESCTNL